MANARQQSFDEELAKVYPGRKVPITETLSVQVFPVGIVQIKKFTTAIAKTLQAVAGLMPQGAFQMDIGDGKKIGVGIDPAALKAVVPALAEIVLVDLLDLISDCCRPKIDNLPHWHLGDVAAAWFEENFLGEGKLRRWIVSLETILTKTIGEPVELWEPLSRAWSQVDTASLMSSMRDSLGSPTGDGASSSSTSGPGEQPESSQPAGMTS